MNSCNLMLFIAELAYAVTKCYDKDDAALFAAIFSQLGDSINTILTNNAMTTTDNIPDDIHDCRERPTPDEEKERALTQ